jgi:carbamoyl-phosphate synthase/aspartate carbamoyltransferase/dihydroorotase
LAQSKAYCDYGIFLGAGDGNVQIAGELIDQVCGMKMYLDQTYGPLRLDTLQLMQAHVAGWPSHKPIAVHAEGKSLAAVLFLAAIYEKPVHICHVSLKEEILLIKKAKEKGIPVTCEVTPHHLYLTREDIPHIGQGRSEVRPRLAGVEDRNSLWENLEVIDCFATDHAPHTKEEKDSDNPPPGFPGLETAFSLMFGAVREGRMMMDDLLDRMFHNPARIFGIPAQADTRIEVDDDVSWEVKSKELLSRCGWTPFEGKLLKGKVSRVVLRGKVVFENGKVNIEPGYGRQV